MTQDDEVRERTVRRFLECEAKRAEARAAALAEGKHEADVRRIAHDAATRSWNAWSENMLARRKGLEVSGKWAARKDRNGALKPTNEDTSEWIIAAKTDFSRCRFILNEDEGSTEVTEDNYEFAQPSLKSISISGSEVDMRGFIFPDHASFAYTYFSVEAHFEGTKFEGTASFDSSIFESRASFDRVHFSGCTTFFDANFNEDTSFDSVIFYEDVTFGKPIMGTSDFRSSTFKKDALFNYTAFEGIAWFAGATFKGGAQFESAAFAKSTSFRDAKFGSEEKKADADFTAIKAERAFNLTGARFSKVPSFCQADFKQAPDLDGVAFPLPRSEPLMSGDPTLIPKYRALRRMAIQSADYDWEERAFRGEMRSRRWKIDKFWHPVGFFGWCYDWAANCGRSIERPFAIWLLSVFVFAVLYLPEGKYPWDRCVTSDAPIFVKSLYISGRNALVLSSGGKDERVTQAYRCLFGPIAPKEQADAKSANLPPADIPDAVSFVESFVQVPLSAVLIFLFLLAVKNRFKIK